MGEREYREALAALSAVAAVIWSGGLIALQIKRTAWNILSTLEIAATAFVLPLIALIGAAADLRIIAFIAAVRYAYAGIEVIVAVVRDKPPAVQTSKESQVRIALNSSFTQTGMYQIGLAILYSVVGFVPTLEMVAKLSVLALVLSIKRFIDILSFEPDKGA